MGNSVRKSKKDQVKLKACTSWKVKLSPVQGDIVGRACTFHIDATEAGKGSMDITVRAGVDYIRNYVEIEGNAKFKVSFTPLEARQHVVSVTFDGEHVPGSPMICDVTEDGNNSISTQSRYLIK